MKPPWGAGLNCLLRAYISENSGSTGKRTDNPTFYQWLIILTKAGTLVRIRYESGSAFALKETFIVDSVEFLVTGVKVTTAGVAVVVAMSSRGIITGMSGTGTGWKSCASL